MVTDWYWELRPEDEPEGDKAHGEAEEPAGVIVTEVDEVLLLLRWAAKSSADGLNGNRRLLLDNLIKFGRFDCSR